MRIWPGLPEITTSSNQWVINSPRVVRESRLPCCTACLRGQITSPTSPVSIPSAIGGTRETIQITQTQIETAVTAVDTANALQVTRQRLLNTAIEEEKILTRRWQLMGGDDHSVGTVLENLLDAQQRRTDAEREWTSAQTQYMNALIDLQRAMGTLLNRSGIEPVQQPCSSKVHFIHAADGRLPPLTETSPELIATPSLPDEEIIDESN